MVAIPEEVTLDALDEKSNAAFPGLVVRKDLLRRLRSSYSVPIFVIEFLLGKYCADRSNAELGPQPWGELLNEGLDLGLQLRGLGFQGPDPACRQLQRQDRRCLFCAVPVSVCRAAQ